MSISIKHFLSRETRQQNQNTDNCENGYFQRMLMDSDVVADTEFTDVFSAIMDVLTQEVIQEKGLASGIGSGGGPDGPERSGGGFEDYMDGIKDYWTTNLISKPIMVNGQYHIFVEKYDEVISCYYLKTAISNDFYNAYLQKRAEEEAKRAEEEAKRAEEEARAEAIRKLKELTEDEFKEYMEILDYGMTYAIDSQFGLSVISQQTFEANLKSKLEKFHSKLKNNHKNWNWNKITAN